MPPADDASAEADHALDAIEEAKAARDVAVEARDQAERATEQAPQHKQQAAGIADDLLMQPNKLAAAGLSDPFGTPGPPVDRRAPFYVGFMGTLGVLSAVVVGLAIREVSSVLVLILVAVFLAVGLNPLVEWLMHRGLLRKWAVLIVSIGVLALVTLFVVALVPVIRDQVTALIDKAPHWLDQLRQNDWVKTLDDKYDVIAKIKAKLTAADFAQSAFGSLYSVGIAVVNALFNAFILFVLTLYFLSALPTIKRACYSLAPESRRTRVTYLGDEILRRVGGYVVGAFVVALCAGVSSFLFLLIVGLGRYAVALALVVAILDFIPLIGATIGAVLVSVIGLATSPATGIACIVFYVIYQQVENYVLYPRVMSSSVNVPGLVTVLAVLIGGSLLGVVGAMLAIPTAAAALLLLRELFIRRQDSL